MGTNVIQQACRSCKHLDVPLGKSGRRVPREGKVYQCTAPAFIPPMPDSVRDGWRQKTVGSEHFERAKRWMPPKDGQHCRSWEAVKQGSWNGSHWMGKRVRAWGTTNYSAVVYNVCDYMSGHPGVVVISNPDNGARFTVGIHLLEIVE